MAHKLPYSMELIIIFFLAKCGAYFTCDMNDSEDCTCATIVGPNPPSTDTVLSNTDVILRCIVADANGDEVLWIQSIPGKQPNALGFNPTIPCCPRYSMNNVGGNYSLTISNVEVSDQGSYFCQLPNCSKSSEPVELTVYILPTGPTIQNEVNGYINVIASEIQNWLICSATNAKPAATLRWYSPSGMLLDSNLTTIPNANQTFDTTASYSFQPTAADNETEYTCQISGDAVSLTGIPFIFETITIFVTEKPAVFTTGVANGGTFVVDINEEATISCEATNPNPNVQINWYRANGLQNTTMTSVETNGTYYFSNSIRIFGNDANDGVVYQCNVTIPGYENDQFYQDSMRFTVSVYQFPYAAVIGGSVGGLILIVLLIVLIVVLVRRSKKKKKEENEERIRREIQATVIANDNTDEQNRGSVRNKEIIQDKQVVPKEITEIEQALKVDLGYDSDSGTSRKYDEVSSSEPDSDTDESVGPPSGETFSISSSMKRSRRGSPVIMYSDLDEESTYSTDVEAAAIPSPHASAPVYYTRETGTRMLTDV